MQRRQLVLRWCNRRSRPPAKTAQRADQGRRSRHHVQIVQRQILDPRGARRRVSRLESRAPVRVAVEKHDPETRQTSRIQEPHRQPAVRATRTAGSRQSHIESRPVFRMAGAAPARVRNARGANHLGRDAYQADHITCSIIVILNCRRVLRPHRLFAIGKNDWWTHLANFRNFGSLWAERINST